MQNTPPANAATQYEILKQRYRLMQAKMQKLTQAYRRDRATLKRLSRSHAALKRNYLFLKKHATERVTQLMERIERDRYQLVFDEARKIVAASPDFLEEIGMRAEEFAASFYVDALFEKYLPRRRADGQAVDIAPFQFPVLLPENHDPEVHAHPFAHFSVSGKLALDPQAGKWRYYLNVEDVSSAVELAYFQKTDKLISTLSISNLNLQKAKKNIEMHKILLISLVCSLVGEYSKETAKHLKNLQLLTTCITDECKRRGLLGPSCPYDLDEYAKDINYTSVLHDIGKMAIPSAILEKDGFLGPEELALVRKHPVIGASYFKRIMDIFEDDPEYLPYTSFLRIPYEICMHHHERWDGTGYPDGLAGEDIPLPARIVAVADSYEAMRGKRRYNHNPRSHQEALDIILSQAGKQFDPRMVEAFLAAEYRFADLH